MYELTISLDTKRNIPLYEQIYDYIKQEIQQGKIQSGERLPSTRALSRHLEVSRSTIELAYEQLLSEGYVETQPYRGFFISQIDGLYRLEYQEEQQEIKVEEEKDQYKYDFSPNGVDLNSFPYNIWRKLSRECLQDDHSELFRLGNPQGEEGVRNAICSYLHQARGVNCRPEQIIVGAGNDYLLMLLTAILGNERKVALENPTYTQAYRLFDRFSYQVCTVDMDEKGMRVDRLQESGAQIAFVMPSHQFPLGIVMPISRRMEILRWAEEEEGRYIIEDDYDSEFRYKGKPIPALQGYDRSGKVIYMGTFSKSIAPAIRMSYMVLPEKVLERYKTNCGFLSSTISRVDQMILQKFIEEGYYERHLNKSRALYKGRHDMMLNRLRTMSESVTILGENAGLHLLLRFTGKSSETELIQKAKSQGVKVYGLSEYCIGIQEEMQEKKEATILLGYANMKEAEITEAIELLKKAWHE
nr:PLP-dependent aminotransferase family protein [uncultured Mediterraneibacter sp.]